MKMTELCKLEGSTLKWQLAYVGPKIGYFGTFMILTSNLVCPIYTVRLIGKRN